MPRYRGRPGQRSAPLLQEGGGQRLSFADITLDHMRHEVTRGGAQLLLTPLEYDLMAVFLSHPYEAFTREHLGGLIWGDEPRRRSNFVDVAVMGLRRKLEAEGGGRLIHTLRGYGYALRERP